jgi:hypothetical protein
MFKTTVVFLLLSLIFVSSAFAVDESETGKSVSSISVNGSFAAITVRNPAASGACVLALIRFNPQTTLGKLFYATLLDAKAAGNLVDITYSRAGNSCTLLAVNSR